MASSQSPDELPGNTTGRLLSLVHDTSSTIKRQRLLLGIVIFLGVAMIGIAALLYVHQRQIDRGLATQAKQTVAIQDNQAKIAEVNKTLAELSRELLVPHPDQKKVKALIAKLQQDAANAGSPSPASSGNTTTHSSSAPAPQPQVQPSPSSRPSSSPTPQPSPSPRPTPLLPCLLPRFQPRCHLLSLRGWWP